LDGARIAEGLESDDDEKAQSPYSTLCFPSSTPTMLAILFVDH